MRRIQIAQHAVEFVAIDVGDEMQAPSTGRIGRQRTHRHLRPEVGATDADVNDVGVSGIGAHPLGEIEHGVQRGLHLGPRLGQSL